LSFTKEDRMPKRAYDTNENRQALAGYDTIAYFDCAAVLDRDELQ